MVATNPGSAPRRLPGIVGIAFVYWFALLVASFNIWGGPPLLLPVLILFGLPIFVLGSMALWRYAHAGVAELAYRDDLTGLANRRAFRQRSGPMLENAKMGTVAMVLVDVDDLKGINDGCGHQTGDEMLVEVARNLRKAAPNPEAVFRIGGDEFAILVDRTSKETISSVVTRLQPVTARFEACGHEHEIHVSFGFASNRQAESFDSLFRRADERLRDFKRRVYEGTTTNSQRPTSRVIVATEPPEPESNIASIEDHRRLTGRRSRTS